MSDQMYDLVDGGQASSSSDEVLWWCPNRHDDYRVKVLSVLPPPPVSVDVPGRWVNHTTAYEYEAPA